VNGQLQADLQRPLDEQRMRLQGVLFKVHSKYPQQFSVITKRLVRWLPRWWFVTTTCCGVHCPCALSQQCLAVVHYTMHLRMCLTTCSCSP
jgi:hypothetical protein